MKKRIIVMFCALCILTVSFTQGIYAEEPQNQAVAEQPLNTTIDTAKEIGHLTLHDDMFTAENNKRYYKFTTKKMSLMIFAVRSKAQGEVKLLNSKGRTLSKWPITVVDDTGFSYYVVKNGGGVYECDASILIYDDNGEYGNERENVEPGTYYLEVTADKEQFSKKVTSLRFHAIGDIAVMEPYLKLNKTSAVYTGKKIALPKVKAIGEGASYTFGNKKYVVKYNQVYDMRTNKKVKFIKNIGRYRICNDSFDLEYKSVGPGESCAVFTVTPQKGVLKAVKSKKRGQLQIAAKKNTAAGRYQIQVSADKEFKTDVQTFNTKKTSQTVKNLESRKKYYVRVRYYKNVSVKYNHGQSEPEPIYGKWSKAKTVVCK